MSASGGVRSVSGLIQSLAGDLLAWMDVRPDGVPRRALLWLDPDGAFARLVPHLAPALAEQGVRLLRYAPEEGTGHLRLKLELLRLEAEPEARAVLYLKGFAPTDLEPRPDGGLPRLWSVFEYRYKGSVWGRGKAPEPGAVPQPHTLATWLRTHGVSFADEKTRRALTRDGPDSLLTRYAERMRESSPDSWPSPLRLSDVLEALGGDPRQRLRALLAAPGNELRRWEQAQETDLILARLKEEFGLSPPEGAWDGEELADAFAIQLALTEAFEAFGEPQDFPYQPRLPTSPEQRQRAASFLRQDVFAHMELGPRFRRRVRRLERDYPLADWAEARDGQPLGLPLLGVERWRRFLRRLEERAADGWRAAADLLDAERGALEAAGELPDEGEAGWAVARDLAELLAEVWRLEEPVRSSKRAADLVRLHEEEGWRIDLLHLEVLAACVRSHGPAVVRRLADAAYVEHVSLAAERLWEMVEGEGAWPPAGLPDVTALRAGLWERPRAHKAVIVTDGLRIDLACLLRDRLEGTTELEAVLATLPTNTPFGMAALLPAPEEGFRVDLSSGKPSIAAGGVSRIEARDGRKDLLLAAVGAGKKRPGIGFADLEALLKGEPTPEAPFLVVFDNTIDELGHKGTEQFPLLVDKFAADLRRAILLLHEAGVAEVHVVTDHGFLLLPPEAVDGQGRPELPAAQVLHKDLRWAALKPEVAVDGLLKLPLPLDPDAAVLGFPRGVRSLKKAEGYMHGGISLQECVVPHLVSRAEVAEPRLEVDVGVATDRLSAGVVPVVLRPRVEGRLFSTQVRTVTVRVWAETLPPTGEEPRPVTEPIDVPVRSDATELRPPLYLLEGLGLPAGQQLVLRAIDRDTGRDLGTVPLTLIVEWE